MKNHVCKHNVDDREATCANCQTYDRHLSAYRTRKILAPFARLLYGLLGGWWHRGCPFCGMPDEVVPFHHLKHNEDTGSAIICEGCWKAFSTKRKVEIYRKFWEKYWNRGDDESWQEIKKAIINPGWWMQSGPQLRWIESDVL